MGFNFRKSIKMGPVRVNLSKSGIGYSVGTKGARISKSAKGKTKVTTGIPGTGLSFSKTIGSKKKGTRRNKTTGTKTNASQRVKANTKQTTMANNSEPVEKSWFMAILMTILSFVVVGVVSFVILFILCAIARLFIRDGWSTGIARFIIIGVPIILGAFSGFIAFCVARPEDSSESYASGGNDPVAVAETSIDSGNILHSTDNPTEPADRETVEIISNPVAQTTSVTCLTWQEREEQEKQLHEAFAKRTAQKIAQFEAELQSIPKVDVPLSEPVERHLLKNLPSYSFSNITRKTRLDSIFPLVFLDVETTGFAPSKCEILEVSAIKFESGMTPIASFSTLCKPKKPIPEEASAVNHITDEIVADAPAFNQVATALTEFLKGCHIAGHNLDFDLRFIFAHGADLPEGVRFYDTLDLAHLTIPSSSVYDYKLDTVCHYYGIWRNDSHRALSDCYATSKLFSHIVFDKTSRQLDAETEILSEQDVE